MSVFKPVVTGLAEAEHGPPDHERLRASARSPQSAADVSPYLFDPPVSPHLAAEWAGVAVEPHVLRAAAHSALGLGRRAGGGGCRRPDGPARGRLPLVRDLAADLALPVVIAARPGLGTISHTLMTLECARAAGLDVRAVVLTPVARETQRHAPLESRHDCAPGRRRGRDAGRAGSPPDGARRPSRSCRSSAGWPRRRSAPPRSRRGLACSRATPAAQGTSRRHRSDRDLQTAWTSCS